MIDYEIRDGKEFGEGKEKKANTRMVLEYEVPKDEGSFRPKRVGLGKYDSQLDKEAANWIECCKPIEFK